MRITLGFLILVLTIALLPDLYIWRRFFRHRLRLRYQYMIGMLSLAILIVYLWMIFMLKSSTEYHTMFFFIWTNFYFFLFYLPKWFFLIISWLDYPLRWIIKKKTFFFSYLGIAFSLFVVGKQIYGTVVGRFDWELKTHQVECKSLPSSFDGYKVIQMSDFHLGNFGGRTQMIRQIVDSVNALQPDMILLTGDLINNFADEMDKYKPILSQLKAKDGVYSVTGNHDYGDYTQWESLADKEKNLSDMRRIQEEMGFVLLDNSSVLIRKETDSIALIGVENWGDPPFPKHGNLSVAMKTVKHVPFKMLITHNPIHFTQEVVPDTDIALTFSGHTHAGQMEMHLFGHEFSLSEIRYKHWKGWLQEGDQRLYVNKGIGYVGLPTRIDCRPEVTLFVLHPQH